MVRFDGGTASPQGDWYFCAANSPRRQERLSRRHPAHARVRDGGGRGACPAAAAARAAARGGVAEIECSLIVKSAAAIAHARAVHERHDVLVGWVFVRFFGFCDARAVDERHDDLVGRDFARKIGPRDARAVDARALELGLAQIDAAQIGLSKITAREVEAAGIEPAQIKATKVAIREIAALAAGLFLVEGTDLALAQQAIEGGGFDLGRITHLIATSRG